jgi:hypothetical protein
MTLPIISRNHSIDYRIVAVLPNKPGLRKKRRRTRTRRILMPKDHEPMASRRLRQRQTNILLVRATQHLADSTLPIDRLNGWIKLSPTCG